MRITDRKPQDVLKPKFVRAYEELHKDIWGRLIHVNTNIIILEKIEKFPFHHFYAPQENIFWTMVYWNFLYISIAFLYGLTTDQGDQKHTLTRFPNRILTNWLKDAHEAEYRKRLKNAKLDKNLTTIRAKIANMRHKVIAHRFLHNDRLHIMDVEGVTIAQLRKAYQDVEKLFKACCFGSQYISNLYTGGTVGGKPVEKDIDNLLDLIVKDSYWLNEPECNKPFWPAIKQHTDPQEVDELNVWRRKFSLPDA